MTFYDYDMIVGPKANDRYALRANMAPLPVGQCVVRRWESHDGWWQRVTQWRSRHGKRYEVYQSLDEALTAGVRWARRREREDRRKI